MRVAMAAALLAASTGFAGADFYVMQDTQTRKCVIQEDYAATATTEVLLKNRFTDRKDAEAAMREVPGCG